MMRDPLEGWADSGTNQHTFNERHEHASSVPRERRRRATRELVVRHVCCRRFDGGFVVCDVAGRASEGNRKGLVMVDFYEEYDNENNVMVNVYFAGMENGNNKSANGGNVIGGVSR